VESFSLPAEVPRSPWSVQLGLLSFLIVDQPFSPADPAKGRYPGRGRQRCQTETSDRRDEHRFSEKHLLSFVVAEAGIG
jgi:hypothetical protein